jgi:hypothetical protein
MSATGVREDTEIGTSHRNHTFTGTRRICWQRPRAPCRFSCDIGTSNADSALQTGVLREKVFFEDEGVASIGVVRYSARDVSTASAQPALAIIGFAACNIRSRASALGAVVRATLPCYLVPPLLKPAPWVHGVDSPPPSRSAQVDNDAR